MSDFTNEAGTDQKDQPRSSSLPAGPGNWVVAVPIVVVAITGLALLTPRQAPERPLPMRLNPQPAAATRASIPRINEPIVRVNVTPGGVDSFRFEVRGPFQWKPLDSKEPAIERLELKSVDVTAGKSGLLLGSETIEANQIEIIPKQSPAVRVNGHLYRGRMRLFRRTDGKVSAVNVLPVEEYLASVVDSEMPAKFPDAARQAQAIVARTYALYQQEQAEPKAQFDLLSSQRSQKYLGVEYSDASGRRLAGESESSRRAVQATRGMVCQRHGKLFCAYYSAVCGGQTTEGAMVFKNVSDVVRTVPCEWCRDSPYYRWTKELSREDFQSFLKTAKPESVKPISIRQLVEPGNGSITQFELDTGRERKTLSGIELRERLPTGTLLSPHFKIRMDSDRVVIEGRGHGHGVGFCQWGAKGQAEAGRGCDEIVRHYFPGAEIIRLNY